MMAILSRSSYYYSGKNSLHRIVAGKVDNTSSLNSDYNTRFSLVYKYD
jgi:hypothetical protein